MPASCIQLDLIFIFNPSSTILGQVDAYLELLLAIL